MSRIAGVLTFDTWASSAQLASSITRQLRHEDWQTASATGGRVSMVHTSVRPSVVAHHGGLVAVVEGTFYNRDELESSTLSDAEAMLVLYRRHGFERALQCINGDFAIALYDANDDVLWLGRDRVGHKPLYFARSADAFGFASQPRALLALPGLSREVNHRFVAVFAGSHYRYIDNRPEESPYAAVSQLPAATILRLKNGVTSLTRYWTLVQQDDFTEEEPTLAHRYRDLLVDAVRRRMTDTGQPAFTLSGGMDSSSVMSCAVQAAGHKLHAFSSVYRDKTYDESEDIKSFLEHKVAQWHAVPIEDFDLMGTVDRMVRVHEEPVATATWLSHFLLCDVVREERFDTLFGGLGGDELNAGEYEYFIFHFADLVRRGRRQVLAHEIERWAQYHDHPIYRKDAAIAEAAMTRMADSSRPGYVRVDRHRLARYYETVSKDYYDLAQFEPVLDHPFDSWLKNRTYQDIFRETAPCCLRAEDRNCTAFGLEHRDPFFDHRLIEFMFRVPGEMKIRDGVTKRLLREAMQGILPEETRTRIKKTGWNAPAHLWFSKDARDQLRDLVASRKFRERGLYDRRFVTQLIADHEDIVASGAVKDNHMMFLWQLVNSELWLQWHDSSPIANSIPSGTTATASGGIQ